MKFLLMLFMLSSLLFSWQKQIILGSYSVKDNGERALETVNKQIENDIQLQSFMKENSLRTINTVISNYTVVSINKFDSYTDLLRTLNALKMYYGDAFVLNYPTKNIKNAQNIEEIEKKALAEQIAKDIADAEKRAELKKLLEIEEVIPPEVESVQVEDKPKSLGLITSHTRPIIEEKVFVEKEKTLRDKINDMGEYALYLIIFAVLALVAIGTIVLFKSKKQDEND